MEMVSEIRARRERLGLAVARSPVVNPEIAAKLREARENHKKKAVVDARRPKVSVEVPEPVVPMALRAKVIEARERLAGCYASKETKLEVLVVLEEFDTSWLELVSESRNKTLVAARREVYRLLHKKGWSYNKIGEFVNRDHTSVMNGLKGMKSKAKGVAALGEGKE